MNGHVLEKYATSNLFHLQVAFCECCVPSSQDQIYHIPHALCSNINVNSKHGKCGVYKPNEMCNIGHTSSNKVHHHLTYFLTYLLTYLLIPWNSVLLEKLTNLQLVKKFPAFYGTRKFNTAFTSARHLSLS